MELTKMQAEHKICNDNWDLLLGMFKVIYESNPSDAKSQYEALKELAKTKTLSQRQADGIMARCDNAMKGEYGNTKTAANFGHGSVAPSITKEQSNGKK